MAAKTWYLTNGVDANGWQALSESTQVAATCNAGWIVGTGATVNSELQANTERASATFVGSTVPDGSLDTSLKDAFRIPAALSGSFASGNWSFQFAVQSPTQGGAADGQIVFRLIKANADGSSPTEITAAQQSAGVCTNVSTSDVNSTLTLNPGAFSLANQYLFVQVAWKRTGAGGMTTTNIRLRTGSAATPTGTVITSANFLPDLSGSVAATLDAATTSAAATAPSAGTLGATLGAVTLAAAVALGIGASASPTLGAATVSAAGTVANAESTGTLAATLGALTASSAGSVDVTATSAPTLGALTASSAGGVAIAGTAGPTLADVTLTAASTVAISGTVAVTCQDAALSAGGGVATAAAGASTLAAATVSSSGAVAVSGTGTGTIDATTSSATGTVSLGGGGVLTLASVASAGLAAVGVSGIGALPLEAAAATGAGACDASAIADLTLDALVLAAPGTVSITGTVVSALSGLDLAADAVNGIAPLLGEVAVTLEDLSVITVATAAVHCVHAKTLEVASLIAAGAVSDAPINQLPADIAVTTQTVHNVRRRADVSAIVRTIAVHRITHTVTFEG